MSNPTYTCATCGQMIVVVPDGRGFPPLIAKNRLKRLCKAAGHVSDPKYRAGSLFGPPAGGMAE